MSIKNMCSNINVPHDELLIKISRLAEDIVQTHGMELVDIEFRREHTGWTLRVFIDKQGGVTIEDCAGVSSQLGDYLDAHDIIPFSYNLEVSSPGLNRSLKREADFRKFIGEHIKVKTIQAIGERRNFKGKLIGFENGAIIIDLDGKLFSIPMEMVEKANLQYTFSKGNRH